jgi:hypothetical protein
MLNVHFHYLCRKSSMVTTEHYNMVINVCKPRSVKDRKSSLILHIIIYYKFCFPLPCLDRHH